MPVVSLPGELGDRFPLGSTEAGVCGHGDVSVHLCLSFQGTLTSAVLTKILQSCTGKAFAESLNTISDGAFATKPRQASLGFCKRGLHLCGEFESYLLWFLNLPEIT